MFILIKAEHGILSHDNEVKTFELHRDAWLEMCRQMDDVRTECGDDYWDMVTTEERPNGYDAGIEYLAEDDHGHVEPCDGPEWQIFEV